MAPEAALKDLSPAARKALRSRDLTGAGKILSLCAEQGIKVLTFTDKAYPEYLRNIEDPPLVLYVKGELPDWKAQPLIGIVGTREASSYGLHSAGLLASQVAACGGMVVSGAAAGIDTAAMEAALALGKPVVGVVAGGVDVVYPAKNRTLYRQTAEKGCLISEYPPGSRLFRGNFLRRNRIISGISQGVLVVEAPERCGALNTARNALAQGRDVFAVPANLDVESGRGSNKLLQEGAYPVFSGWDVMKHYAPLYPDVVKNRPVPERTQATSTQILTIPKQHKMETASKNPIDNLEESTYSVIDKQPVGLSEPESGVFALLDATPQPIDSILDAADLSYGAAQAILTRLMIKGLVIQHPDGRVSRK